MKHLEPPPSKIPMVVNEVNSASWYNWFANLHRRLSPSTIVSGFPKATLTAERKMEADQTADSTFSTLIFVPDATGGPSLAFSDGTDWISVKTGNPI